MKNVSELRDYTHCEWCNKPRMVFGERYVRYVERFYRVPTNLGYFVVCSRCKRYMWENDRLPEMNHKPSKKK